jgi:hypothetical protein
MGFGGEERRGKTRFRVRLPFLLKANGFEAPGTTRNLSLLGIAGYTSTPLTLGQVVDCHLEIPKPALSIISHGTVVRCDALTEPHPDGTYEMGVFFRTFEPNNESLLTRFLNHLSREEDSAVQAGLRAFKEKIKARKRRKRLEALQKKRRALARKKKRLAKARQEARKRSQRAARRRKKS